MTAALVQLPPRVSIEDVRRAKWDFRFHARLGGGGVMLEYQCVEHPRLFAFKGRASGWRKTRTFYAIDRSDHALTLEEAVAVLNGHEPPVITEEEALLRRWPLADQIALVERELGKRRAGETLEGLEAVRLTLLWLRKHEAKIKQRVDGGNDGVSHANRVD